MAPSGRFSSLTSLDRPFDGAKRYQPSSNRLSEIARVFGVILYEKIDLRRR